LRVILIGDELMMCMLLSLRREFARGSRAMATLT
jgi:hypothetical protein